MAFDLRTMQYELTTAPFALPSMGIYKDRSAGTPFYLFMARSPAVIAGLRRTYTRAVVTPADEYVLLTTVQVREALVLLASNTERHIVLQGDFSVFNIPNMIYRSSVPVRHVIATLLGTSEPGVYFILLVLAAPGIIKRCDDSVSIEAFSIRRLRRWKT